MQARGSCQFLRTRIFCLPQSLVWKQSFLRFSFASNSLFYFLAVCISYFFQSMYSGKNMVKESIVCKHLYGAPQPPVVSFFLPLPSLTPLSRPSFFPLWWYIYPSSLVCATLSFSFALPGCKRCSA